MEMNYIMLGVSQSDRLAFNKLKVTSGGQYGYTFMVTTMYISSTIHIQYILND